MITAPVSVVMPCFRAASSIERAIGSAWTQSCRPAELIAVDDGSDDGTLAVLEQLQRRFGSDWLKLEALPRNAGPSAARNLGWAHASQPLLAFLDSDDTWHPEKIALQCAFMRNYPEIALTAHRYAWQRDGVEPPVLDGAWSQGALPARPLSLRELLLFSPFPTPSVMLRTHLPHRFDETKRRAEDTLLWLQIVASGAACWLIDLPLCQLHKAPWGEAGLSHANARMWVAGLDTFRKIRHTGKVPTGLLLHAMLKHTAHHLIRQTFTQRG